MKQTRAWQGRTDGGAWGQHALLVLFKYADIRLGYVMATLAVPFYLLFRWRNARAIYHYFRQRQHQRLWLSLWNVFRNHVLFGCMLMDRFACYAGKGGRFRVVMDGEELFDQLSSQPDGFVTGSAHAGNFEMAGYLLQPKGKQMFGLVFGGEAAVVQQERISMLAGNRIELIPVQEDLSHLFKLQQVLCDGQIVCLPCDRNWGSAKQFRLPLLGAEAGFPAGPFTVAARLDKAMVALFVMKSALREYTVHVRMLSDPADRNLPVRQQAEAMAARYTEALGEMLGKYPLQWFNFYEFWS